MHNEKLLPKRIKAQQEAFPKFGLQFKQPFRTITSLTTHSRRHYRCHYRAQRSHAHERAHGPRSHALARERRGEALLAPTAGRRLAPSPVALRSPIAIDRGAHRAPRQRRARRRVPDRALRWHTAHRSKRRGNGTIAAAEHRGGELPLRHRGLRIEALHGGEHGPVGREATRRKEERA